MAGVSRSELPRRAALGIVGTWRQLNFEQRTAGIGALLLIVSTFGPFSFVEAAIVLIGPRRAAAAAKARGGARVPHPVRRRHRDRRCRRVVGRADRDPAVRPAAGAEPAGARVRGRTAGRGRGGAAQAAAGRPAGEVARGAPARTRGGGVGGADRAAAAAQPDAARACGNRDRRHLPLGERRPRVGPSDAPTETRRPALARPDGRRSHWPPPPLPLPLPPGAMGRTERYSSSSPRRPVNEPLPPPEFHLPGENERTGAAASSKGSETALGRSRARCYAGSPAVRGERPRAEATCFGAARSRPSRLSVRGHGRLPHGSSRASQRPVAARCCSAACWSPCSRFSPLTLHM